MLKSNLSRSGGDKNKQRNIYLDYAASALVGEANPGATHEMGTKEKSKLGKAREIVASILRARRDEVIFTSGATESNNLAILGLVQNFKKPHIITTNIEHPSVLEVCKYLEKMKQAEVTYLEVEENGILDPRKIKKAFKANTVLVSVMYANNEIGTVQPIMEIAKEIRYFNKNNLKKINPNAKRVFFHTDATQAINYLPINVAQLGVDLMSFNGAKNYGPKGIGVLFVKKNTPLKKIMFGGDQEFGLRPGTENVGLALKMAKALEITEKNKVKEVKRLIELRDYFIKKLNLFQFQTSVSCRAGARRLETNTRRLEPHINGDLQYRLPNNVNVSFPKIPSDLLVIELSAKGIMASAKSACKSGEGGGSHVIKAICKKPNGDIGGVRFSLGKETTKKDIDYTVKSLSEILNKLKKWYN